MNKLKSILIYILQFLLIPLIAYAAGKATASSKNMTAQPISGVNSSGVMVPILVDDEGIVQTNCI